MSASEYDPLELWDQAGEQPYEVLKEEGLLDEFLKRLDKTYYDLSKHLFRGTHRHYEKSIGDVIVYDYPSSWSSSDKVAQRFIDGEDHKVILRFITTGLIKAVENTKNSYDEQEFILHPMLLSIVGKHLIDTEIGEVILFDVVLDKYL